MGSANSSIAAHTVSKLFINIEGSYFELVNVRRYLKNRRELRKVSASENKDDIRRPRKLLKKICTSATQGTGSPEVHAKNIILNGISREWKVIRWLAVYAKPEVYDELVGEKKRNRSKSIAQFIAYIV